MKTNGNMAEKHKDAVPGYGTARVPLTCGELVQGRLNGRDFLVTCPIDWWVRAWAKATPLSRNESGSIKIAGEGHREWDKTSKVLAYFLERAFTPSLEILVEMESPAPVGKGLATSTADMVAALSAAGRAVGHELSPEELSRLVLSVEPSDGVMFPGVVYYEHRGGEVKTLAERVDQDVFITVIDFGGTVDTLHFNRRKGLDEFNEGKASEVSKALEAVTVGLQGNNWYRVGEGATRSAFANQDIHCKEGLEELWEKVRYLPVYGIVTAHSGTVAGVLHPKEQEEVISEKINLSKSVSFLGTFQVVSGGIRKVED